MFSFVSATHGHGMCTDILYLQILCLFHLLFHDKIWLFYYEIYDLLKQIFSYTSFNFNLLCKDTLADTEASVRKVSYF